MGQARFDVRMYGILSESFLSNYLQQPATLCTECRRAREHLGRNALTGSLPSCLAGWAAWRQMLRTNESISTFKPLVHSLIIGGQLQCDERL